MEQKINITAKDGEATVLTGAHFHELEGFVSTQFVTTNIKAFVDYLKPMMEYITVYHDSMSIRAFSNRLTKYEDQVAYCGLNRTKKLKKVVSVNDCAHGLSDMEKFLDSIKRDIDGKGTDLLSRTRDFRMSAVTDVQREKDGKGNYSYSYSRKNKSREDDVKFPETITVTVQLFENHPDVIEIPLDVYFDYVTHEDSVDVFFTLTNYDIEELIEDASKAIILSFLTDISAPVFQGTLQVEHMTDSWKYKSNKTE